MKLIFTVIIAVLLYTSAVLADVYVIEYESYKWNPCSGNICYSVICPIDGCHVDGKYIICKDESCVTNILDKNGEEHLAGIWAIDYQNKTSKKMQYKKKYRLESELSNVELCLDCTIINVYDDRVFKYGR